MAVNQRVVGSNPTSPFVSFFVNMNTVCLGAYNSRVEYTSDKRAVGSSSLPRLIVNLKFGEVAEWSKALVLKTSENFLFVGSNPPFSELLVTLYLHY